MTTRLGLSPAQLAALRDARKGGLWRHPGTGSFIPAWQISRTHRSDTVAQLIRRRFLAAEPGGRHSITREGIQALRKLGAGECGE